MRKNQNVRSIYFDGLTLRQLDELAAKQKRSRSQLVRLLVRQAAAEDKQAALPGMGSSSGER